jgi:hypothetical protein
MKRLFRLVGQCFAHREPVLLVGDTGCGKTTVRCRLAVELVLTVLTTLCALQMCLLNRCVSCMRCCGKDHCTLSIATSTPRRATSWVVSDPTGARA